MRSVSFEGAYRRLFAVSIVLFAVCPAAEAGDIQFQTLFVSTRLDDGDNNHDGGVVADINNDGYPDIIFRGVFLSDGQGGFVGASDRAGLSNVRHVVAADVDEDGWVDLFNRGTLYRNQGDGGFTAEPGWTVERISGVAWGDLDLDGDLDALLGGGYDGSEALCEQTRAGMVNRVEATRRAVGSEEPPVPFSPRIVDLNQDGLPDILWVNDFRRTQLWMQESPGVFVDTTADAGLAVTGTEMGVDVADFDDDGDFDIIIQDAQGAMFFSNDGAARFTERGRDLGIRQYGYGWGMTSCDLDNDGALDFVGTGHRNTNLGTSVWAWRQTLDAHGAPAFEYVSTTAGLTGFPTAYGISDFDMDGDGDSDLVVYGAGVMRNDTDTGGSHWLRVALDGRTSERVPPHGIGSIVRARLGERWLTRWIDGGTNYRSQSELVAHFGLGDTAVVDELRVEWTDGQVTTWSDVPANQSIVIPAPEASCRFDRSASGRVDLPDLAALLLGFGATEADDAFDRGLDFVRDKRIDLADLAALLARWDQTCDPAPMLESPRPLAIETPAAPVQVGVATQIVWADSKSRAHQIEVEPIGAQRLHGFELDANQPLEHVGGGAWYRTEEDAFSGTFAFRSAPINAPMMSSVAHLAPGGRATIRFMYRHDLAPDDRFFVTVGGAVVLESAGVAAWTPAKIEVMDGQGDVEFRCYNAASADAIGLNGVLIDDLVITRYEWTRLEAPPIVAVTPAFAADFSDGRMNPALGVDSERWSVREMGPQSGYALESPALGALQRAQLALETPAPGTLSFAYRVIGTNRRATLEIGESTWYLPEAESAYVEFPVAAGAIRAVWRVFNRTTGDAVVKFQIDNIRYTPAPPTETEYAFPADMTSVEWTPTVAMPECRVRIRAFYDDGVWGPWIESAPFEVTE